MAEDYRIVRRALMSAKQRRKARGTPVVVDKSTVDGFTRKYDQAHSTVTTYADVGTHRTYESKIVSRDDHTVQWASTVGQSGELEFANTQAQDVVLVVQPTGDAAMTSLVATQVSTPIVTSETGAISMDANDVTDIVLLEASTVRAHSVLGAAPDEILSLGRDAAASQTSVHGDVINIGTGSAVSTLTLGATTSTSRLNSSNIFVGTSSATSISIGNPTCTTVLGGDLVYVGSTAASAVHLGNAGAGSSVDVQGESIQVGSTATTSLTLGNTGTTTALQGATIAIGSSTTTSLTLGNASTTSVTLQGKTLGLIARYVIASAATWRNASADGNTKYIEGWVTTAPGFKVGGSEAPSFTAAASNLMPYWTVPVAGTYYVCANLSSTTHALFGNLATAATPTQSTSMLSVYAPGGMHTAGCGLVQLASNDKVYLSVDLVNGTADASQACQAVSTKAPCSVTFTRVV